MAMMNIDDPAEAAAELTRGLRDVHGDDLVAAVLYGSVARGEHRPGVSDINVLVLLRELDVERLTRAGQPIREWQSAGNPPPLMMTLSEWRSSADVFPIEYTDIRSAHQVLHGDDPFAGIEIHREHLRLQLENELRTRKIQLREAILSMMDSPEELGTVVCRSISSFNTLFRALLRLAGRAVPTGGAGLIEAVGQEVGFATDPLLRIFRCRDGQEGIASAADREVLAGYLAAIEMTVLWLDRFPSGSATDVI